MKIAGRLVLASGGSNIQVLDLTSREHHTAYRSTSGGFISHVTKLSDEQVVFDECSGNCSLKTLHLQTKEVTALGKGYMPTYLSNNGQLFFYDNRGDSVSTWLLVATLDGVSRAKKVAKAPSLITGRTGLQYRAEKPVVQIDANQVAFVGEDLHIWIYLISEGTLKRTSLFQSYPVFWVGSTQELVCFDWDSNQYYSANLQNEQTKSIPELQGAFGMFYTPELGLAFYGRARRHLLIIERHDLYFYSLNEQKEHKLADRFGVRSGAWIP